MHEKTRGVRIPKSFLASRYLLYFLTYDSLRPLILSNFCLSLYSRDYDVIVSWEIDLLQSSQDNLCLSLKIFQKPGEKEVSTCCSSSELLFPSSYLLPLLILSWIRATDYRLKIYVMDTFYLSKVYRHLSIVEKYFNICTYQSLTSIWSISGGSIT